MTLLIEGFVCEVKVLTVENSYWDRVSDLCYKLDILFLGFCKESKRKDRTKCRLFCKDHLHYWETTNVTNFLQRKSNPCTYCAKERRRLCFTKNEEDYLKEVVNACEEYNTDFIGWSEKYKGSTTKITHRCKIHNVVTHNTSARSLVERRNKTSGCEHCQTLQFDSSIQDKTSDHIKEFFSTGVFPEGTIFKRNTERTTVAGVKSYWNVYCPNCEENNTSFIGSLKKGKLPCKCSKLINDYGFYPERSDWEDTLYLLKYYDNIEGVWYKIGRSFCLDRRLSNLRAVYRNIEVIGDFNGKHIEIFNLEKSLHLSLENYKYTPLIPFGGAGECFTPEILTHPEVISTFNLNKTP